ncbi:MAG TPA: proton-conducting transporter membrane subunit [Acidimicrobiales bacterium]|nr:proton-conducting transporter membrane subunit [Acidimicrobiales bacterium]
MAALLVVLLAIPFAASVVTFYLPRRPAWMVTVVTGAATFVLSLVLIPTAAAHAQIVVGSVLRVDALSVVFLVATTFLYAATAIFAGGYLHLADSAAGRRYSRRFYAGLNLFCWSMVAAPLVNGLALLWVAIEITTVISALLVAIDDTDGATEASWKYVLIASLGLGIALLATIIMYYAGSTVFGSAYDLSYVKLLAGAARFPPDVVRLAFVLAVLGFGTKMGLVPVHTWLPDAHSEAPTPVSALLSGALLATSFYAILRYFQIAVRTLGPTFPRNVLLIFGLASLLLAALYLLSQRDLKRLLAYSSVEHMGILAIGMSFGAPIAVVGVLLHVLAHAAAKGTAFFGAGSVVRKFATKDMTKIRGGIGALPWSGPMFVVAILALSAMPPFGIFRSEFLIVSGGLSDPRDTVTAVLVVLATVAFFGLSWFTTQTMLTPDLTVSVEDVGATPGPPKGEVSGLIVVAMGLGIVALVILGVHPPAQLSHLLDRAASQLGVPR